jgi:hypothetical protein
LVNQLASLNLLDRLALWFGVVLCFAG